MRYEHHIDDNEISFLLPKNDNLRTEISVYLRDNRFDKKIIRFGNVLYIVKILFWVLAGTLSLKVFEHAYTFHQLANAFEKMGYETNIRHSLYVIIGTIIFLCVMPLLLKLGMDYWEKLHEKVYAQDNYFKDKDSYFYANKHSFIISYKIQSGQHSSTASWSAIKSVENIENKCIVVLFDNYTSFFCIPKESFQDELEFQKVFEQLSHWQQESRVSA